jgi:hypothetical protein
VFRVAIAAASHFTVMSYRVVGMTMEKHCFCVPTLLCTSTVNNNKNNNDYDDEIMWQWCQ